MDTGLFGSKFLKYCCQMLILTTTYLNYSIEIFRRQEKRLMNLII